MRTLVIGGTGTVGSFVVRELLSRGLAPRVLVRAPETQRTLPRGAEGVLVDLSTPGALVQVFDGTEALFLATAPGPNETAHGLVAVQAARAAKVHRCVYVSHFRLEEGSAIPHFASKIPIERVLVAYDELDLTVGRQMGGLRPHPDGRRLATTDFEVNLEVWAMENFLPKGPPRK